jgi:hypothetical protein
VSAAKKIILLLWLVVTSLTTASALTPGAAETRVGQKSFAPLESRQAQPLQTAGRHQENAGCGYELAPESLLAAESGAQLEFGFVKNLENPNFVLYKSSEFNPSMLRPGEYTLNLPYLRNEALDWAQNQQALQRAMNIGNPIREANPNALGGWLQRERDFMSSQGWQRAPQGSDVFWTKPPGQ